MQFGNSRLLATRQDGHALAEHTTGLHRLFVDLANRRMLQSSNSVSAQLQDARDALTRAEEHESKAWILLQHAKASYARAGFVTTTSRKSVQPIRHTFYGQGEY